MIRRSRRDVTPASPRVMLRLVRGMDEEVRRNLRGESIESENAAVLADALEGYGHTPVGKELLEYRKELLLPPDKDWGKIAKSQKLRRWRIVRGEIIDALRNLHEPARQIQRRKKIYRYHRRRGTEKTEAKMRALTEYATYKKLGSIGDPQWGQPNARRTGGGPVFRKAANMYVLDWLIPVPSEHGRKDFVLIQVPLHGRPLARSETVLRAARANSISPTTLHKWWSHKDPMFRAKARQLYVEERIRTDARAEGENIPSYLTTRNAWAGIGDRPVGLEQTIVQRRYRRS